MIHPDDRERMRSVFRSAIEHCAPFESEGRYNLPDGRQRIIFVRGMALPDESGKTQRLLSVVQDVTEIRQAETQAASANHCWPKPRNSPAWAAGCSMSQQQSFTWSAQMFRLLGLAPEDAPVPLAVPARYFTPTTACAWRKRSQP